MIKQLGKYSILKEIGRGSMGMVYQAKDKNIGRIAAIKTIKLPDTTAKEQEELTRRFKQEAMAAGNLNHPNIVTIYEYDQVDDTAFIAMEFIEGFELKTSLDNNEAFTEEYIITIMQQLLAALQYSHQHGVIHRDIKPSNLMITGNDHVKVTDFGIARLESSELTQVGATIGTPSYMSPEQCTGQTVDARSDIFSAGVLLYQLLTGEKPFAGPSITSILHKITQVTPPNPSQLNYSISSTFDEIIKKALAKRPADRFQSATEFSEAFNAIGTSPQPPPTKPVPSQSVDEDATMAIPLDGLEETGTDIQADETVVATGQQTAPADDATIAVPLSEIEAGVSDETMVVPGAASPVEEDATIAVPLEQLKNQGGDDATIVVPQSETVEDDATVVVPAEELKKKEKSVKNKIDLFTAKKYLIIVSAVLFTIVVGLSAYKIFSSPESPASPDTPVQPTPLEPPKPPVEPLPAAPQVNPPGDQSDKQQIDKPTQVKPFYTISTIPSGAQIEHASLGLLKPTPVEVEFKPGIHQLYITKEGYQDMSIVLMLDEKSEKDLTINLLRKQQD